MLHFLIFASCILEGLNVLNILTKKFFPLSRCCPWGSIWCWADSTMYKVLWKSTNSQSSSVVTCNSSKVLSSKYNYHFFCLDSYIIYCYCCSKTFSTVAQKSLQMNLMVFMSVMNGIERVVCLSPVCLYAFKGTPPRDGVAIFRPQQKSYPPDKSFSRR